MQLAGTGTTRLRDNVTTTAAAGVDLTTAGTIALDGLTIATNGGLARFNGDTVLENTSAVITTGGNITFANGTVSAAAAGLDLTLNSSTGVAAQNGGAVTLTAFDNAGGQFVNDLSINTTPGAGGTAGILTLTGNIFLDDSNGAAAGGAPAALTLTGVTDIRLAGSVEIDTEQGDDAVGGALDFSGVTISANALGRDLILDTSTTAAGANGGAVTLGTFSNAAGQFVNDLTINTTPGAGGAAGTLTLTNNISLDHDGAADAGDLTLTGGGDVLVANTVTIDTEQGNSNAGGAVNLGASNVFADAAGRDLSIDTRGVGTGGNVTFGLVDNNAGANAFINDLSVDTSSATDGIVALSNSILVDNNAADLASVTMAGDVRSSADVAIDTEQGDNAAGGTIVLTDAGVSATATEVDLTLNTLTGLAAANGGAVTLGLFANAGGQFVNDLAINTTPGAGGTAGVLTLTNNIALDHNGAADAGDFTLIGNGDVLVANSLTIDTEQGNANAGGAVNLGASNIYADVAGRDLTINTATTAAASTGGAVTFGLVDDNAGANGFINDLSVDTRAATNGVIALSNNILVDNNAADLASVTMAGDTRLGADVLVDTEQGGNSAGGAIALADAAVSATATDVDLQLNSATAQAAASGGAVTLGLFANAGGQFVNDLAINTTPGAGGAAGILTLTNNISLDDSNGAAAAGTPSAFTLTGVTDMRLTASVEIDNEQGDDADGGILNFAGVTISANALGRDLILDTATAAAAGNGGAITLATLGNLAGQFVNDLTINTAAGAGGTAGALTLTNNISLDHDGAADAGDLVLAGNGDVVVASSVTIDTEQGNANAGGAVNLAASNVFADVAGRDLTINTATTAAASTGGAVTFGLVDNNAGANSFINDLSVDTRSTTAGVVALSNNILVDDNTAADLASVTVAGDMRLGADVLVDSEQGNNTAGGVIVLTNATVSATAPEADLTLNTSTALVAANGGAVTLSTFGNAGGQFVNDLSINTAPGAGGTAGNLTLTNNISLDHDGAADPGDLTVSGGAAVVVANNVTIDTENGDANAGGDVLLGTGTVFGNAANMQLTLNARGLGSGGDINFGTVSNGAGLFLSALTARTNGPAGVLTLDDPITTVSAVTVEANLVPINDNITVLTAGNITATALINDPAAVTMGPGVILATASGQIGDQVLVRLGGEFIALQMSSDATVSPILPPEGIGKINVLIVDPNGLNYQVTIDWLEPITPIPGSPPPPPPPIDRIVTELVQGSLVQIVEHLYRSNPALVTGGFVPVAVNISGFAQGTIQLQITNASNVAVSILDVNQTGGIQTTVNVPIGTFIGSVEVLPIAEALPTAPEAPPIFLANFEFQSQPLQRGNTTFIESTGGGVVQAEERYYELRIVSFDENGNLVETPTEQSIRLDDPNLKAIAPFDPSKLPALFGRLPPDRYRIYLIEDGTERLILDFVIEQGQPVEVPETFEGDLGGAALRPSETMEHNSAAVPAALEFGVGWASPTNADQSTTVGLAQGSEFDDHGGHCPPYNDVNLRRSARIDAAESFAEQFGQASFLSHGGMLVGAAALAATTAGRWEKSMDRVMEQFGRRRQFTRRRRSVSNQSNGADHSAPQLSLSLKD